MANYLGGIQLYSTSRAQAASRRAGLGAGAKHLAFTVRADKRGGEHLGSGCVPGSEEWLSAMRAGLQSRWSRCGGGGGGGGAEGRTSYWM